MVHQMPDKNMFFQYEIYNDVTGKLLNLGETKLAFVNISTRKPMRAPEWFLELVSAKLK